MFSSWLGLVHPSLEGYSAVFEDYGADSVEALGRSLDDEDITELGVRFERAGVKPMQVKAIRKALEKAVAAVSVANESEILYETPNTAVPLPASSGAARKQRAVEALDSEPDAASDDDLYEEEEEEEEEAGSSQGKGRARASVSARPFVRHGTRCVEAATTTQEQGRASLHRVFEKSSADDRYGLGGRAASTSAEAGRARSLNVLGPRGVGVRCIQICKSLEGDTVARCHCPDDAAERCLGSDLCARRMSSIIEGAVVALRTPSETIVGPASR